MIAQRARKRLLWALSAALLAAVAAAVAGAWLPLDRQAPRSFRRQQVPVNAPALSAALKPVQTYAIIYQADLRRPLFDAPASIPATAPAVTIPIKLTGTIVEPGFCYALFRCANGEAKMAGAGEVVDGVEVVSITATSVTVRFAGQVTRLTAEKEDGPR